ncbi:hypothetical protein MKW92_027194 [Papaver armeniacum]|nr:hypothetical protein MKW92_027194 [Papaver armeniacum]
MGRPSDNMIIDEAEAEAERMMNMMMMSSSTPANMPLLSLNHVSYLCKSVSASVRFYEQVLGFVLIKRPSSFKFQGAWLFNYGIGIHLLECNSPDDIRNKKGAAINPKDNHISFQCSDMKLVMRKLEGLNIEYVTATVEEGGVKVDQLFFHDPDGYMIEICNCDNLPVLPLSSSCPIKKKLPQTPNMRHIASLSGSARSCAGEVEDRMLENLFQDLMDLSF